MRRILTATAVAVVLLTSTALPAHAAQAGPDTAVVAGDFQSEVGCPADWAPDCTKTALRDPDGDGVATLDAAALPAGTYHYKIAVGGSWDVNYGRGGRRDGADLRLVVPKDGTTVRFYFDVATHVATTDAAGGIPIAVGSFQSELGCPSDWNPSCLRGWLQDRPRTGVTSFSTTALPVGRYAMKIVLGESWDRNYGRYGTRGGANIPFRVTRPGQRVTVSYVGRLHLPVVSVR